MLARDIVAVELVLICAIALVWGAASILDHRRVSGSWRPGGLEGFGWWLGAFLICTDALAYGYLAAEIADGSDPMPWHTVALSTTMFVAAGGAFLSWAYIVRRDWASRRNGHE
jgi:drug/metabolite transporter (DMT)-like permease